MSRFIAVGFASFAIVFSTPLVLGAESLREERLRGATATHQGSVASEGSRSVQLGGRGVTKIKDIADSVLSDHRKLDVELVRNRSALYSDPIVAESVFETSKELIIESRTSFTVSDGAALRGGSTRLKGFNAPGSDRPAFDVSKLSNTEKSAWQDLKKSIARKPDGHPLKKALDKGEDDFIVALKAGLGDFTVTSAVVIRKTPPRFEDGKLYLPTLENGRLDFDSPRAHTLPFSMPESGGGEVTFKPKSAGSDTYEANFLTGFTQSKDMHWETKWVWPTGYFRMTAGFTYAFGVRLPVKITATLEPSKVALKAPADTPLNFTTTLSATTLNASKAYYTDLGLSDKDAYDGKELVIQGGPYVTLKVVNMGAPVVNKTIPSQPLIDFGQHFTPPYGGCGSSCGFDVWIPAETTHTNFNLVGLKGSAQLGFNVGGDGDIDISFVAQKADGSLDSTHGGVTSHGHTVNLTAGKTAKFTATLPSTGDHSTKYGYFVHSPVYNWDVEVTPRIKATVDANFVFFKVNEVLGPIPLPPTFQLGTLTFKRHVGTTATHQVLSGNKTYTKGARKAVR